MVFWFEGSPPPSNAGDKTITMVAFSTFASGLTSAGTESNEFANRSPACPLNLLRTSVGLLYELTTSLPLFQPLKMTLVARTPWTLSYQFETVPPSSIPAAAAESAVHCQ